MVSKQISMDIVAAVLIGATTVDGQACSGTPNRQGLITLPASDSYLIIPPNAFKGCDPPLTWLKIPTGARVTEFGTNAFKSLTKLKTVEFVSSNNIEVLKKIGVGAFEGATGPSSFSVPQAVTEIKKDAFKGATALVSVIFADFQGATSSLTSLGESAFEGTSKLITISIPDGVKKLEPSAFDSSGLESIIFGPKSKLEEISFNAFGYAKGTSKLATIIIPDGVKQIEPNTFMGSVLKSITFGPKSKLDKIGASAFRGASKLTAISIPDEVKKIEQNVFMSSGLKTITFGPNSKLEEIGANAFRDANNHSRRSKTN